MKPYLTLRSENGCNDGWQYVIQSRAQTSNNISLAVGLIIGFIFGFTNIIRYGPGPNGMLRTLGQYMIASSATFGYERSHFLVQYIANGFAKVLHVNRHDDTDGELAYPHRSVQECASETRETDGHVEGANKKIERGREGKCVILGDADMYSTPFHRLALRCKHSTVRSQHLRLYPNFVPS